MFLANDARFPFTIPACLPWSFAWWVVSDALDQYPLFAYTVRITSMILRTARFLYVLYADICINATAESRWSLELRFVARGWGVRLGLRSEAGAEEWCWGWGVRLGLRSGSGAGIWGCGLELGSGAGVWSWDLGLWFGAGILAVHWHRGNTLFYTFHLDFESAVTPLVQ